VDILEDWRLGRTDRRLFWLTGAPGTGKGAFCAWATAMHVGNVVALNLCRWDLRERCDAARVVRTLAWFVARRVQDYRGLLLRLMRRLDRAGLDILDAPTLFDRLLVQPLTQCFHGGRLGERERLGARIGSQAQWLRGEDLEALAVAGGDSVPGELLGRLPPHRAAPATLPGVRGGRAQELHEMLGIGLEHPGRAGSGQGVDALPAEANASRAGPPARFGRAELAGGANAAHPDGQAERHRLENGYAHALAPVAGKQQVAGTGELADLRP